MKKIKMPDTFVIIFFVVVFASLLTYIVPVGKFEMHEVTYVTNTGEEKTRTVPVPGSFKYELDDNGNKLTKGIVGSCCRNCSLYNGSWWSFWNNTKNRCC